MPVQRYLSIAAVGWLGLILTAALQSVTPLKWFPGPDIILLIVVYVALSGRGDLAAVLGLSLFLGYIADLYAGSPKGIHLVAYGTLGLVARLASARLMVRGALLTSVVAGLFALVFGAAPLLLRTLVTPDVQVTARSLARIPIGAASTALFAPFIFRLLRRIDRVFGRDPRILERPKVA